MIKPPTFEELKKLRGPIRNVNIEHKEKLTRLERVAIWVTERVGTMGFFLIVFLWTILWLLWNTFAPAPLRFDAYPGFILWLFISNAIQLILMPLIMVGQNMQGKHAEARAESDFELNIKAEIEIETILHHLEKQHEIMLEILHRLEK